MTSSPLLADEYLNVSARFNPESAKADEKISLVVTLNIHSPYHINANPPSHEYLIPTSVTIVQSDDLNTGSPIYPQGKQLAVGGLTEATSVYQGTISIRIPFSLSAHASGRQVTLRGKVQFQPCDDHACFAPSEVPFSSTVFIISNTSAIETRPAITAVVESGESKTISFNESSGIGRVSPGINPSPYSAKLSMLLGMWGRINSVALDDKGILALLTWAFFGGLALNLTPCVYPLIPITIGYFARQVSSRRRRLLLVCIYVGAMALTYALIGTSAALTGSFFGSVLQSPWVLIALAGLMVLMALSMWGTYDLAFPHWMHSMAEAKPGVIGAASMGATMGIVAAPCIGPFIVGLLTYVGSRGNAVEGFALFFALGLGLGAPYIVLGALSESVASLPKVGVFLIAAKRLLGLVLLGMALWFLRPLIGMPAYRIGNGVLLVGGGLLLFFWGYGRRRMDIPTEPRFRSIARKCFGTLLIASSIYFFMPLLPRPSPNWKVYSHENMEEARRAGKIVMVDVSAAWCIPCKELDDVTFSDSAVVAALNKIVVMRADVTGPVIAPEILHFEKDNNIVGVPTILFFDTEGREIEKSRLIGFEKPDAFLARISSVYQNATP